MALFKAYRLVGVDSDLKEFAEQAGAQLGFDVGIPPLGGVRTAGDVSDLFAKGRDEAGNITDRSLVVTYASDPTKTAHYYGMAIDLAPYDSDAKDFEWDDDAKFQAIGELARKYGFTWGGDWHGFQDKPHVELSDWESQRDSGRSPALIAKVAGPLSTTGAAILAALAIGLPGGLLIALALRGVLDG